MAQTQTHTQTPIKLILVGRGELSRRQRELLKKALGGDFTVVKQLEQVNTPKEIVDAINETNATVVFSFVLHPTVIHALETARKILKNAFDYYAPSTDALWTKTYASDEMERGQKECYESGGDIPLMKIINGKVSIRCVRTTRLLKNPVVKIEAEETIE